MINCNNTDTSSLQDYNCIKPVLNKQLLSLVMFVKGAT